MALCFFVGSKGVILYDREMETEVEWINEIVRYYHNFNAPLISLFPNKKVLVYFEEPLHYWVLPDLEKLTEKAKENIRKYLSRIEEAANCGMVKIYIDKDLEYLDSNRVKINNPKEIKVEELKRLF